MVIDKEQEQICKRLDLKKLSLMTVPFLKLQFYNMLAFEQEIRTNKFYMKNQYKTALHLLNRLSVIVN